jgi:chromosomal replication initiator protein
MSDNDERVWLKALEFIKKELSNEQTFNIWFRPIKFISVSAEIIVLEVPNKFFQAWLLERYMKVIASAVVKACGKDLKVDLRLSDLEEEHSPKKHGAEEQKKETKPFWPFTRPVQDTAREIGLLPKYNFDSFVVGSSNRFAHAASLAVSDSPAKAYNPLFIYGGVGLGKTHLMHAIGQRVLQKASKAKVLYISSEDFTNQLISSIQNRSTQKFREKYRNVDVLLIDDIQFIAGKESTQEEFFHTFNALYDSHKQIVVSSDRPPKEIQSLEERLVSRFEWGLVTDIQPPDFETRMAILKKKSEKETIAMPEDVFYFLAEKVKTNIRELEGALIRVVAYAKLIGKEISLEMSKEVLRDMIIEGEKKITIDLIQKKVSEYFDIKPSDMRAKKRSRAIAYPRQVAMYLARQLTDMSLPEIGDQFGGRDHTTVIHAYDKIENDLKEKSGLRVLVDKLINSIKN